MTQWYNPVWVGVHAYLEYGPLAGMAVFSAAFLGICAIGYAIERWQEGRR